MTLDKIIVANSQYALLTEILVVYYVVFRGVTLMAVKLTRKDVAELAGVSVTAVSRVMNNSGYVAKNKREAILKAAKKINYRPRAAKSIMQQPNKQLLFYNKDLYNEFTTELYCGMVNYASQHDYMVLLSGTWDIEKFKHMLIDGVILPNDVFIDEFTRIIGNKIFLPIISASYGAQNKRVKRIPLVECDTYKAMELIIDYLFERNHTKIALAAPYKNMDLRYTSYVNKMHPLLGKSIDKYIFTNNDAPPHVMAPEIKYFEHGELLAQKMYETKCDATAVCCFNDNVAIGMIQQFTRLGVRIPGDISIVGIDGVNIGSYTHPKLTSVALSPFKQGSECVRVLLDMIAGKKVKGRTSVPIEIIERESVRTL